MWASWQLVADVMAQKQCKIDKTDSKAMKKNDAKKFRIFSRYGPLPYMMCL